MKQNTIERIIHVKNEREEEVKLSIINQEKFKEIQMKKEDSFIHKALNTISKNARMIFHIFNLNRLLNSINEIQKENILKYGYLSEIEKNLKSLETKIELFKAKILSLFTSIDKYKQGRKLYIDGYLADLIIKILIKKYHNSFNKINLDFGIAQEIINYFTKDCYSLKKNEIIQALKDEIFLLNQNQIQEVKNGQINIEKDKNNIKFIKNIFLGNIIISPTELNFILELFFYIKEKGNQIDNSNLEPEKIINFINEEISLKSINNIIKEEDFIKSHEETNQALEKAINSNVKDKMEQIKSKIKNYFINNSTKKNLNMNEIMDFMLLGKISAIIINIDNAINEDCEIDWPSFESDMIKLEEYKGIIERLKKEKIIEKFNLDINTKEYENLKYLISSEFDKIKKPNIKTNIIKKLIQINYSTFIDKIYDKTIEGKFPLIYTEQEYMEIIYSIAIPFIIEIEENNYEALKSNLINQFQEMMIMLNIKNKTEKILNICQDYFKEAEITEDYIKNVKQFCLDKKDKDYKDIIELDIDVNSIIFYLKKLIGKENISWLENDEEKERFSLTTLLYFYQNKLESK